MNNTLIFTPEQITNKAKLCFKKERAKQRLDGWFLAQEIATQTERLSHNTNAEELAAQKLYEILRQIPLTLDDDAMFAGTQSDAFARTYALINPTFAVETFSGYCDPTAVYADVAINEEFTAERIAAQLKAAKSSDYVRSLSEVYAQYEDYTKEVAFFIEQVTGHLIPDFRPLLARGTSAARAEIAGRLANEENEKKRANLRAMDKAMQGAELLAERYAALADAKATNAADTDTKAHFTHMAATLRKVPRNGADDLYEAIQSYLLCWQVMCLEQAPNPFAFSVGNADRLFEPYRAKQDADRATTAALLKHFLVFFNVGDRSWAISQNILIGGKDADGQDLSNLTTYALLDAYYDMNLPQPILSVKLHKGTPDAFYQSLGRFFFTPGMLTPSLFNDDALFEVLTGAGIDACDLPDYSVAGCQEPLIMGKDNGNTTNSWLNMPKILELTLNGGISTVTGERVGTAVKGSFADILQDVRGAFYRNLEFFTTHMTDAANGASRAISHLPVPFLSACMGGIESGVDLRDTEEQGTKYNGSGCLIHGLSVIADSFIAIDHLLTEHPDYIPRLQTALQNDFAQDEELRQYLLSCPKFGNNCPEVDNEAAEIVARVSDIVSSKKNYLGNPFRADWSSPSTHLLYGYWVGATPDGRHAREMLGYGIDPLYGEAGMGLGFRMLSGMQLPYEKMKGGYASHFGIDPKYFRASTMEEKGLAFASRVIAPLFFNTECPGTSPFYLYVNVTTPDTLRKVLAEPEKYAPGGVYIMRIHGTFVNFLDLSPAIQTDIIKRLDLASTAM